MDLYEPIVQILKPLAKIYHRPTLLGAEFLPSPGEPFILTPNHTSYFGWDAMLISTLLSGWKIRWLSWSYDDDFPLWDKQVELFGGILHNNKREFPYRGICDDVLGRGEVMGIFPEGTNNEIGNWYRLQPFFPGCVRLAVMSGAPIVPVSVAGIEESSPIFWIKREEGASPKWLITYPGLFPTKVTVRIGEPFHPAIEEKDLRDKRALEAEARKVQEKVLRLLVEDRPRAYSEIRSR